MGTALCAGLLASLALAGAGTDWPVFFEHLGRVHSIHNKWELTFKVNTNFHHVEQKLRNISRQIYGFQPSLDSEAQLEFAEDIGPDGTADDKLFRLVNQHWEGLADLLKRRSDALIQRLNDYRCSDYGAVIAGAGTGELCDGLSELSSVSIYCFDRLRVG
jgi:hypothetical protein